MADLVRRGRPWRCARGGQGMGQAYAQKIAQVQALLGQNKPDAALALLQRMAAKSPADPDISTLMSMALMQVSRPEQALFYAQRSAASVKDDPIKLTNLAIIL